MSFISIFDVMGPNMIGPSSSHTAGAARIGFLAQKMINGPLKEVNFTLYGSFARTFKGHGTDRALLGGIMGFSTDDMRIRNSFEIAKEKGLTFSFTPNELETDIHPNTVDIHMVNNNGQEMTVRGESLGGGKVRIVKINSVQVDFSGEYSAIIVIHQDKPGVVAALCRQMPQRPQRQYRLYAPFPRVQRRDCLHDRRIRRTSSGGYRTIRFARISISTK